MSEQQQEPACIIRQGWLGGGNAAELAAALVTNHRSELCAAVTPGRSQSPSGTLQPPHRDSASPAGQQPYIASDGKYRHGTALLGWVSVQAFVNLSLHGGQGSPSPPALVLCPGALSGRERRACTLACCMPGPRQATARTVWSRSAPHIVARGSTASLSSGVGGGLRHSGRCAGHALRIGQELLDSLDFTGLRDFFGIMRNSMAGNGKLGHSEQPSSAAHRLPR